MGLMGHYLAGVVLETLNSQLVAAVLDQLNDGVVEGILVLVQPSCQVVGDGGGVVDDGKVRVRVGAGVGLGELGPLALCRSMSKSKSAQYNPSRTCISCSRVSMWELKNCCSFLLR